MKEQLEQPTETPELLAEKIQSEGMQRIGERYINIFYNKALRELNQDKINPIDFEYYDKEMISKDNQYVKIMKEKFRQSNSREENISLKFATILEAIINKHITLSNWLGENAYSRQASDFDNLINGIDTIVEFETKKPKSTSHLGLAMDVTFSNHLSRKIDRIKKEIDQGKLPEIKYFESDIDHTQGRVQNVPRVVIAFNTKSLSELAALWI